MREITIEDLRYAFRAGKELGSHNSYFDKPLDEDEYISEFLKPKPITEQTIPITLGFIKRKCGWSEYCEVTGANEWMLREWSVQDNVIFNVKITHAEKLGFV